MMRSALLMFSVLACAGSAVAAQWLTLPTANIPRTRDGRPDLKGPPPRLPDGKPDLRGIWTVASGSIIEPPSDAVRPAAKSLVEEREESFHKDRPFFQCRPWGPELFTRYRRFVQSSTEIVMLFDDLTYRVINMDGRQLEPDPERTWMGYSVGRWEGDTLVVDSTGFNDRTYLTRAGFPHSEALRTTERYRRTTAGAMHVDVTIADPPMYTRPWSYSFDLQLQADTEMVEGVCESDQNHWTGRSSDAARTQVALAPAVLAKYVGVYSGLWGTQPRTVTVKLVDGVLRLNGIIGEVKLLPQSESTFKSTEGYDYRFGGNGDTQYVIETHVSGDWKYDKQR